MFIKTVKKCSLKQFKKMFIKAFVKTYKKSSLKKFKKMFVKTFIKKVQKKNSLNLQKKSFQKQIFVSPNRW